MKKQDSSHLLTGSLIIAFMLFIPYAFYLYKNFPDEKTYEFFNLTFTSNYFESVRYFMYNIFSKLIPLSLLLIWFTTCKHWWFHAIAIPISVYIFQFISVINDDTKYYDEYEFVYSLPITIIILAILYFIRSKIGIYIKAKDIKKEMDEQMNKAFVKKGE
ncbi:hypothetical protein [Urechidicola vernalis]|uniref:Uncharacterized protein n=1 Tax=Urechidicola vernalis TaxID=3075600 RepID=A0ABU2YAR5_9FLAO|nr:hypothetical protein [Urechidicola sp. P050]MDT0554335.1 hypothetical protein [Urechidicola sp. P050]